MTTTTKTKSTKSRVIAKDKAALKAEPKAKADNAKVLDANYFGAKLGVAAKIVRKALRKSKALPKPAAGWVFKPAQEKAVLKAVTDWLTRPTSTRKLPKGMQRQDRPAAE